MFQFGMKAGKTHKIKELQKKYMRKNLQLPLIKQWFDLTKSGEKREDYREITPYWCNRLLLYDGKSQSMQFWKYNYLDVFCYDDFKKQFLRPYTYKITPKVFHKNIMSLGYPKFDDKERFVHLEHKGVEIRDGLENWGAERFKLYFVVKHGEIIK